jgi:hypothetical protein
VVVASVVAVTLIFPRLPTQKDNKIGTNDQCRVTLWPEVHFLGVALLAASILCAIVALSMARNDIVWSHPSIPTLLLASGSFKLVDSP